MVSNRLHLLNKIFPWLYAGDVKNGNYVELNSASGIVLKGTTTVYEDIFMSIASAKVPAANYPAWEQATAHMSAYSFAIDDHVDLATVELPHSYAEGTDIEVHVHIANHGTDIAAKKVKYRLYYTYGLPNSGTHQFTAEAYVEGEITFPANIIDRSALYVSIGTIDGSAFKIGTQFKSAIYRVAASGDAPTLNPFIGMVGIHYQANTLGSSVINSK